MFMHAAPRTFVQVPGGWPIRQPSSRGLGGRRAGRLHGLDREIALPLAIYPQPRDTLRVADSGGVNSRSVDWSKW